MLWQISGSQAAHIAAPTFAVQPLCEHRRVFSLRSRLSERMFPRCGPSL